MIDGRQVEKKTKNHISAAVPLIAMEFGIEKNMLILCCTRTAIASHRSSHCEYPQYTAYPKRARFSKL